MTADAGDAPAVQPRPLADTETEVLARSDLNDVLHQAARALFGATAIGSELLLRTLSESAPSPTTDRRQGSVEARELMDVAFGIGWAAAHVADRAAGRALRLASPVIRFGLAPPLVPTRLTPMPMLRRASAAWNLERAETIRSLSTWSATVVPAASQVAVSLVDVDELIMAILKRMDLEKLATAVLAQVDMDDLLEKAAADIDVSQLVERLLSGIDLTPMMQQVMASMDLAEVVRQAAAQVDLSDIVMDRMDLMRADTIREVHVEAVAVEGAVSGFVSRTFHRKKRAD